VDLISIGMCYEECNKIGKFNILFLLYSVLVPDVGQNRLQCKHLFEL